MLMPSIFENDFVDDFFDDMFSAGNYKGELMKTDVKDTGDYYKLEIEMPGMAKENITAELKDGYLTVTAHQESSEEKKDEKKKYIRKERYSGSCQRSFFVGKNVRQEEVRASYKDGILTLTVPKENKKAREANRYITIGE
ncbi:MAG: Hsp20/alpha crystallin family protein [Eubacterium sp.]|nr:Hsp20/alpha crystallin family protein [Eubacterium sp.]MDD7209145.1 Hsp20/alpha crystallin family protein [Lachnospiraceae bacterium]MDY5498296.1 Hsp20/alpha crystallin family protein [Anaerobutyricum sp.]